MRALQLTTALCVLSVAVASSPPWTRELENQRDEFELRFLQEKAGGDSSCGYADIAYFNVVAKMIDTTGEGFTCNDVALAAIGGIINDALRTVGIDSDEETQVIARVCEEPKKITSLVRRLQFGGGWVWHGGGVSTIVVVATVLQSRCRLLFNHHAAY
jgi:hypothetical protein